MTNPAPVDLRLRGPQLRLRQRFSRPGRVHLLPQGIDRAGGIIDGIVLLADATLQVGLHRSVPPQHVVLHADRRVSLGDGLLERRRGAVRRLAMSDERGAGWRFCRRRRLPISSGTLTPTDFPGAFRYTISTDGSVVASTEPNRLGPVPVTNRLRHPPGKRVLLTEPSQPSRLQDTVVTRTTSSSSTPARSLRFRNASSLLTVSLTTGDTSCWERHQTRPGRRVAPTDMPYHAERGAVLAVLGVQDVRLHEGRAHTCREASEGEVPLVGDYVGGDNDRIVAPAPTRAEQHEEYNGTGGPGVATGQRRPPRMHRRHCSGARLPHSSWQQRMLFWGAPSRSDGALSVRCSTQSTPVRTEQCSLVLEEPVGW